MTVPPSAKALGDPALRAARREFVREQLPLIVLLLAAGVAVAYLQHGYLPGGERPFPLAGVRVPVWHLIWMGAWTGYTMAIVGEAAGIFALPYSMSVLQFSNIHVTPTTQLLTFLNPLGALLGFRRSRQWNRDLALWVCLGGVVGGLCGPFLRLTVLADARPFTFAVGLALVAASVHLCASAGRALLGRMHEGGIEAKFAQEARRRRALGLPPSGLPAHAAVETVAKGRGHFTVAFWGLTWRVRSSILFGTGASVGVVSSALGVGGGFLLVPIFVALYRMPVYILVAATIPYVIVLSAVALLTYGVILPVVSSVSVQPEWAWGFFAAAGGVFGSWFAAKTQRFIPESFLKLMLGAITGMGGVLYVADFFYPLPFRI